MTESENEIERGPQSRSGKVSRILELRAGRVAMGRVYWGRQLLNVDQMEPAHTLTHTLHWRFHASLVHFALSELIC